MSESSVPSNGTGGPAGALDGIRVLDLTRVLAGPLCAQMLGDLGADVIKINTLWDEYWHRTHIAYVANRGKRSLALMLKHPKAMEALKKLIATADVVQHNMRYDAAQRLGVDYETLSKEFPRLIYCHTRGFEKGPRMGLPGNDQTGACLAGIQYEDGAVFAGGKPLWSLTARTSNVHASTQSNWAFRNITGFTRPKTAGCRSRRSRRRTERRSIPSPAPTPKRPSLSAAWTNRFQFWLKLAFQLRNPTRPRRWGYSTTRRTSSVIGRRNITILMSASSNRSA